TRFADNAWNLVNVNKIGFGWVDDAYFSSGSGGFQGGVGAQAHGATGLQLTTNWNVWAAFQHYWTPEIRTSLYGGYSNFKANSSAVDVDVCQAINAGTFGGGGTKALTAITGHVSPTGCADWAAWAIGSRTLWNPVRNLDVGVDVLYTSMAKSA